MNIPKAIEILKSKAIRANQAEDFELGEALQLGIEALKLTKRLREVQGREYLFLLPGETHD